MKKLVTAITLACALLALGAPTANAAFGIESFDGEVVNQDGSPATQAGAHPYEAWTAIDFNTTTDQNGSPLPDGNFRTIETMLPPGAWSATRTRPRNAHSPSSTPAKRSTRGNAPTTPRSA